MSDKHRYINFDYIIRFQKTVNNYRLQHYNQWHNSDEKTFDDIRVIFEGKDLKDNDLSLYKVVSWEALDDGLYEVIIKMLLYEKKDQSIEQVFTLKSLNKVNKKDDIL